MPAPALDAAVWSRVSMLLTNPQVIGNELARMWENDPTEADLARADRLIAQNDRQRDKLLSHLAHLDTDSAAHLYGQLEQLSTARKELLEERDAVADRQRAWELARGRLAELEAWCGTVAANLRDLTYQQKRLALDALSLTVRVYRSGHSPRYEIEASVGGLDDALVFNTR